MANKSKWLVIGLSVIAAVALVVVIVLYTDVFTPQTEVEPVQEEASGIAVSVVTPQRGRIAVAGEYIGRVEPDQQVAVIPRTAGEVLAVYYEVGDTVKAGDLLFELDPTDIAIQVAIAEAGYAAAEAQVEQALGSTMDAQTLQAESGYKNAKAAYGTTQQLLNKNESTYNQQLQDLRDARKELGEAKDSLYDQLKAARAELARKERELENASSTPSLGMSSVTALADIAELQLAVYQLEQAYSTAEQSYRELDSSYDQLKNGRDISLIQLRSSVEQAETALDTAEASIELLEQGAIPQGRAAADAQLRQAEAQVAAAQRQLDFTKVTAPISGVVEMRSVEPNNMVGGSNAAMVISNKDMMTVSFQVAESALAGLSLGDAVVLDKDGIVCKAVITELPTMIDTNSGLFAVKAGVAAAPFDLRTGSSLKVRAETQKAEGALTLPLDCLYYENGKPYVYVARDGTAVKTFIEAGISDSESIQLLSGVSASDRIIATWNNHLRDGAALIIAE